MTKSKGQSKYFHITLADDQDETDIEERLKATGIPVKTVRTMGQIVDGISMTELLAMGEWNQDTGYNQCQGACLATGRPHVSYSDLTDQQKFEIHEDMGKALDTYRAEHYLPDTRMMEEHFKQTRTGRCDGEQGIE